MARKVTFDPEDEEFFGSVGSLVTFSGSLGLLWGTPLIAQADNPRHINAIIKNSANFFPLNISIAIFNPWLCLVMFTEIYLFVLQCQRWPRF